ncbi:MAG: cytosol nonspecific dipeptidase [Bacteroidetes bacterium GWF2_42_66]|nr:MAG: cytosol nonspecific dipeptidase [Bacteroidetes bacterium GWA2_42_15]OFX99958.1 MAG: cytosol nonspecific dipeptidase [Bacteroidetes bacterium GWE2_42_39]OFY40143.1 MAG: cytosol nonspecific dipeptidase [Bacteroidetes bacterium GWF2_42_66]HBL73971.1 cytosol nonspecific dipeptidase [Prolixibacteraceae bacterium]HCR89218.1 cytosol nonspecific dipeptidase [Prolixibacteraceae bacterium]
MNKDIRNLEPKALWENFYQLTQIPRPSHHEERIQEYVFNFGKKLGLETIKDEAGNIIIRKPATPGMENRKGVIFQGHLDMVPQKNSDKVHDFVNDPIEAYIDGEWVTANGTTLGADNGIGVSTALTILASKDIQHGPVEALFTATEETGMDGAEGLKPGILKGDILLNTDSEDEGELYVGCAGGEDASAEFSYSEEKVPAGSVAFKLNITGMKGGHSGMDIILGRGNANKTFFRILKEAYKTCGVRLASIEGGSLRNAIPREAFGLITVAAGKADAFKTLVAELTGIIKAELSATEPDMKIELAGAELPSAVIDEKTQVNLTHAIMTCPNGVIRMSDSMKGLVETSSNMAIVKSDAAGKTVRIACLMRSSVDSAKEDLASCIESAFVLAGAKVTFTGAYPGWKPNMESPILKTMQKVYQDKYGKIPEIKAIHAGLECGILGGIYPNWDMISFGPTIRFPHSPDEKVNIATVQKFWDFTLEVLKNIPKK